MLTEEQQAKLIELCQISKTAVDDMTQKLAAGEKLLRDSVELLQKATEDIHMLLAFINSKGLEPPQIKSKFIN